jgi:hypothetical protein
MLLGEELEQKIREAWLRVRESILADERELRRRLARRRMKSLRRPPRAWCLALRASGRRIGPGHWVIWPEHAMELDHPEHPYEVIEHEVIIRPHALLRYCRPFWIASPGQEVGEVAKRLGMSESGMRNARRVQGVFDERRYRGLGGKRGRAVPVIFTRETLDPSGGRYWRGPHAVWGSMWWSLAEMLPEEFEQGVVRRPVYRRMGKKYGRMGVSAYGGPEDHQYKDEMQLIGWRWVCPGCGKEVRTIYYPVKVSTVFDCGLADPAVAKKLGDVEGIDGPAGSFACAGCHEVQYFSTVGKGYWNQLIFHLSGGCCMGARWRGRRGLSRSGW